MRNNPESAEKELFRLLIFGKKENFQMYIKKLDDYCQKNNVSLLRTVGVVFSDDERRLTQYEKWFQDIRRKKVQITNCRKQKSIFTLEKIYGRIGENRY